MMNTDRLRQIETWTLLSGAHDEPESPSEAEACVMEAVAYVAGEPWSDHPACACPVISEFLRSWNDGIRDNKTRTRLLRPLIPRVVGSKSTPAVEMRRSYLALDWLVRVQLPAWLDAAGLRDKAALIRSLAELHDEASCWLATEVVRDAQRSAAAARAAAWDAARAAARAAAWDAARAAAWDAAWDAARDAARAAAGDAARAAARAAAWDAAGAAARAAAWDAAGAAAWDAARDAARAAARAAAWDAAGAAAWAAAGAAARAAAGDALKPMVESLQASALALVERMLALSVSEGSL